MPDAGPADLQSSRYTPATGASVRASALGAVAHWHFRTLRIEDVTAGKAVEAKSRRR
jgi:hypothetical protein